MRLESALERTITSRHRWCARTDGEPSLAGQSFEDIRAELREGTQERKEEILGALVRITQDDPTAFGVVAVCLLPGLRHRIGRYAPCLDRQEALAVAVVALYEAVASYDTRARPSFVAGRLLASPSSRLRRTAMRQRPWLSRPDREIEVPDPQAFVDLTTGAILGTAVDAGVLARDDARLILDTRVVGTPLREAGRRMGLSYEAAKKRRQRAEARWIAWWLPDQSTAAPRGDSRGAA